jgi:hypothetical protein
MYLSKKRNQAQRILAILPGLVIPSMLWAQQAITASGATKATTFVQISYTLGESFIGTFSTTNSSLAQGVQMGHIQRVSIDELTKPGLKIKLSYQPGNETIQLVVDEYLTGKLTAKLSDTNGRILSANLIKQRETEIPCGLLPPAMYLLHIFENTNKVQSYKIQIQ